MIISRRNCSGRLSTLMGAAALGISALLLPAVAEVITSFSVGKDQALTVPSDLTALPDEHTTFMPLPGATPGTYLVFAAASNMSGASFGTVALETSDLTTFTYPTGFTNGHGIAQPRPDLQCAPCQPYPQYRVR